MELIYSMRRKPLKCEPPYFSSTSDPEVVRPICTISSGNIIAFSSPTELTDMDGDTWGGHVYVCDLDTPWDSHKVTSTTYPVSALEWDSEGKQLLVATTVGEVSVYGQKDFLLNEWTCLYTANFPGEHIVRATFFHNGRRVVVCEKKPDAPLAERVQVLRPTPTLKGFGGVPCDGVCVVSSTGLVAALAAEAGPPSPPAGGAGAPPSPRWAPAVDSLRAHRDHVTHASMAHKNGAILVAALCVSGARSLVRCALVAVGGGAGGVAGAQAQGRRAHVTLQLQPLPTVCLPDNAAPTCVSWTLREDADSLVVGGARGSQLWRLAERKHPLHKLLAKGAGECGQAVSWQAVGGLGGEACAVAAPRLRHHPHHRHLAMAGPAALHLLNTDTHHLVCSRAVPLGGAVTSEVPPSKKAKYGAGITPNGAGGRLCSADVSWLGGAVVVVDTHAQLHVFRLPQPWTDIPSSAGISAATAALEYALVAGYDCLDLLLTLRHNVVDAVYDRLTESFQRHPSAFQQYYYHAWLKMRIALCRLVPSGSTRVSWLSCVVSCAAAWCACACALRADDKPDAHALLALLDDHHPDHDKALAAVESKPEGSADVGALVGLRRVLQRAGDVALSVLASVASHPHAKHGQELWSDPSAVLLLRKLVGVSRGVVAVDPAVPRVLARLQQQQLPPKQDLIEECMSLSASWCSQRVWECLPRAGVSAPHGRAPPHYLEYGVEPEALRVAPEPPAPAPALAHLAVPPPPMDSIRYMYLGGGGGAVPPRWRQCSRCGALALAHAQPARQPLQRAHDNRFLPACRCGGKWTLFSNV